MLEMLTKTPYVPASSEHLSILTNTGYRFMSHSIGLMRKFTGYDSYLSAVFLFVHLGLFLVLQFQYNPKKHHWELHNIIK